MLAHIWSLADIHHRGKLDHLEFAVAMQLVNMRLKGQDVPRELPLELVPPAVRDLSALSDLAKLQVFGSKLGNCQS
jgi:Cytoskeletal-regulatory complex EF hand